MYTTLAVAGNGAPCSSASSSGFPSLRSALGWALVSLVGATIAHLTLPQPPLQAPAITRHAKMFSTTIRPLFQDRTTKLSSTKPHIPPGASLQTDLDTLCFSRLMGTRPPSTTTAHIGPLRDLRITMGQSRVDWTTQSINHLSIPCIHSPHCNCACVSPSHHPGSTV